MLGLDTLSLEQKRTHSKHFVDNISIPLSFFFFLIFRVMLVYCTSATDRAIVYLFICLKFITRHFFGSLCWTTCCAIYHICDYTILGEKVSPNHKDTLIGRTSSLYHFSIRCLVLSFHQCGLVTNSKTCYKIISLFVFIAAPKPEVRRILMRMRIWNLLASHICGWFYNTLSGRYMYSNCQRCPIWIF